MNNKLAGCLLLVLLSIAPYLNTLKGEFVYDDSEMVLENRNITGRTTLYQIFFDKRVMSFSGEIYRPLRDLSYKMDWMVGGKAPMIYHVTNVLLHIAATLAAYWFLILLVSEDNRNLPLMAAAIFAVHPLHTESVAWVKGRDDMLFTIFYLLSFAMYLKYENKDGWKGRLNYLAAIVFFVLSLFSKEMAVTLPITIALYQVSFKRVKFYAILPFFIIAAAYMGLRTYVLGQVAQQEYWGGVLPTMLTMTKGIAQYVRLSFLPINQCADYLSFPISTGYDFWSAISLVFLFTTLACLFNSRDKFVIWGGLFFFMTLLPVLNIIPIKIPIAERFLYLPILGFCVAMVSGIRKITNDRYLLVTGWGIILLFLLLTVHRNYVWSDEYSLWSDTLKKAPGNARAHYGMGRAYDSKGMIDDAIREYSEAERMAPSYPDFLNALGLAYYRKGMVKEAAVLYRNVLKIDPRHRDARYNLAFLYQEQGMVEKAIKEYTELVKFKPDDFDALNGLGLVYFQRGLLEEALSQYKKALSIDPESVASYNNIGMVYAVMGKTIEAEMWFKKGLKIDPQSAETYYNLGYLYQNAGRLDEAAEAYKKAIDIRPGYNEARTRLREFVK